jgi:YidC/Oxa1 family membrane protein insertase
LFNNQAGLDHINYFLYNQAWRLTESPDPYWLGLNLAVKPMDSWNSVWVAAILIPVITGALQFIQSKMMMPVTEKTAVIPTVKGQKKEEPSTEETMATVQSQMVFIMPVMIGYFAYTFPIGLALYWNMFSILGIYQQYMIGGWGGLRPWLEKAKLVK